MIDVLGWHGQSRMTFSSAADFRLLKTAISSENGQGNPLLGSQLGAVLAAWFWGFVGGEIPQEPTWNESSLAVRVLP